jgi:FtsH-binding integral membrane protein
MKINKNFLRGFMNKTFKAARKVAMIGSILITMMLGVYMPVYATSGVSTLNNYLLDIFGAFGVTVIIFGGFSFGKAMTERDSASKITALEIVIGGVVMVGIRTFVGMFGG